MHMAEKTSKKMFTTWCSPSCPGVLGGYPANHPGTSHSNASIITKYPASNA